MPKLENWFVISCSDNPFQDSKILPRWLVGDIYGDPRFEDGMNEKESNIIELINNLLSDKSLDSHTLNIVIEKINEL